MADFMDLPQEMRDIINVHASVTDNLLYIEGSRQYLSRTLLTGFETGTYIICKVINTEATPIFYGKKTFVLPDIGLKR